MSFLKVYEQRFVCHSDTTPTPTPCAPPPPNNLSVKVFNEIFSLDITTEKIIIDNVIC